MFLTHNHALFHLFTVYIAGKYFVGVWVGGGGGGENTH